MRESEEAKMSRVRWTEQDCGEMPLLASEKIAALQRELKALTIFLETMKERWYLAKIWSTDNTGTKMCQDSIDDIDRYLNKEKK